ncbi:MAG TPA: hypothetical protein VJU61_25525 [Polyangiaceae bacterium]|nr:hypothetical protein [Polyangiaceae bacterium]
MQHMPFVPSWRSWMIGAGAVWLASSCGADSPLRPSADAGIGGSAIGGASGAAGSLNLNGGSGGSGGSSAGSGGSAGSGPTALPVPRVETSDGISVLDTPQVALSTTGLCTGQAVYCNGSCLDTEGAAAGNCSVLKLGLGQTQSLHLSADALYYTAANREILRAALAGGAHTSIARGLVFPAGLYETGGTLFFSARAQQDFPPAVEVRRMASTGGEITVLSQPFIATEIEYLEPIGERLLFGVGNFDDDLYTVSSSGGQAEPLGPEGVSSVVIDGNNLYFKRSNYVVGMSMDAPASAANLNQTSTTSRIVVQSGYAYLVASDVYQRVPLAGGPMEPIQTFTTKTTLLARTPSDVLLYRREVSDAGTPDVGHLLRMPIAGGTATELVSIEDVEYQDAAANATHLYLALGVSHAGAILKISLE